MLRAPTHNIPTARRRALPPRFHRLRRTAKSPPFLAGFCVLYQWFIWLRGPATNETHVWSGLRFRAGRAAVSLG